MPRARTDAVERKQQRDRIVGRGSLEASTAVSVQQSQDIIRSRDRRIVHPPHAADVREYATRGITGYLTRDRTLDFRDDEVRFVGDMVCEVSDLKVYGRSGMLVLNLQTTDEHLVTLTDAVRLSRAHPLFVRLYELFPKPASPWADGTHPDDPHEAIPGVPHSHPNFPARPIPGATDDWETDS